MPRSAASLTWSVVGGVLAVLLGLGVIFGPRLYREGRAMVGPIVELSRSDEELAALDRNQPFTPPADGRITEERLDAFLAVRRDLEPYYRRWTEITRKVERQQPDTWKAAKDVLAVTREVFSAQIAILRQRRMSPAELRWLEQQVYDGWLDHQLARDAADADRRLRQATEGDLRFVGELRRRFGGSPALDELDRRLGERLRKLSAAKEPTVEEGPNGQLLRAHRTEIEELRLADYAELQNRLLQPGRHEVTVRMGRERKSEVQLELPGGAAEATPAPGR